jgi:hypothetical protein
LGSCTVPADCRTGGAFVDRCDRAGYSMVPRLVVCATRQRQRRSRWSQPCGEGSVKPPADPAWLGRALGLSALLIWPTAARLGMQNSRFWISATSRTVIVRGVPKADIARWLVVSDHHVARRTFESTGGHIDYLRLPRLSADCDDAFIPSSSGPHAHSARPCVVTAPIRQAHLSGRVPPLAA